jgi:hypothetical protein
VTILYAQIAHRPDQPYELKLIVKFQTFFQNWSTHHFSIIHFSHFNKQQHTTASIVHPSLKGSLVARVYCCFTHQVSTVVIIRIMFSANENIQLRQYKKQIVQWVEDTIPDATLDLGVNVMVMQVTCKTPGCVPIETAIIVVFPTATTDLLQGLPESQGGSYKTKILKPMSSVTQQDVLEALPPAFEGGLRSMEGLCRTARDVMLAQITQLMGEDDVDGRTLMAQYLQQALQDYIDRKCIPPEWGQSYAPLDTSDSNSTDNKKAAATQEAGAPNERQKIVYASKGNIVLRRPMDDDTSETYLNVAKSSVTITNSHLPPFSSSSSLLPPNRFSSSPAIQQQPQTNTMQQQQPQQNHQSREVIMSKIAEWDHAPGVRRAGCPCCDPDHPSNIVDSMMQI